MVWPGWWVTIMGALAPLIIQAIKTHVPQRTMKFIVSILICAACGVLGAIFAGKYAGADVVGIIVWTFTFAQASYGLWWKKLFDSFISKP